VYFVSVTRLRLRSSRFVPGFFLHAMRTNAQVRRAPGFQNGALLPDRHWTFWTMTAWNSAEDMRAYILNGAHKSAMPKLLHWCDEASIVHWDQLDAQLPSWQEADRRMRQDGRVSRLRHPGADHAAMTFAPPRTTGGAPINPAR
jgi:hypothetical protein